MANWAMAQLIKVMTLSPSPCQQEGQLPRLESEAVISLAQ
jgi:hypothetical protein